VDLEHHSSLMLRVFRLASLVSILHIPHPWWQGAILIAAIFALAVTQYVTAQIARITLNGF
jgi:hypothetical protein